MCLISPFSRTSFSCTYKGSPFRTPLLILSPLIITCRNNSPLPTRLLFSSRRRHRQTTWHPHSGPSLRSRGLSSLSTTITLGGGALCPLSRPPLGASGTL